MTSAENPVRAFLREEIASNPDPVLPAVESCGVSRKTVLKHLAAMRKEGSIHAAGDPRKRRYRLAPSVSLAEEVGTTTEDISLASERCQELCDGLPDAVLEQIDLGLNELISNARQHAQATTVQLVFVRADPLIEISIRDRGPGLFQHLRLQEQSPTTPSKGPIPQGEGGGISRCLALFDRALWWSENSVYGRSHGSSLPVVAVHDRRRPGTTARLVIDCRRLQDRPGLPKPAA